MQVTLKTLGGGRPAGEFNRALRRLSRLHQRDGQVHEVTLKAWIRPGGKPGKKQLKWAVRTGIASGRQELALSSGKAQK